MSPSGKIRATIGLQFNDVSSAGLLNRNAPGAIFLRHAEITQIMGKKMRFQRTVELHVFYRTHIPTNRRLWLSQNESLTILTSGESNPSTYKVSIPLSESRHEKIGILPIGERKYACQLCSN